MKFVKKQCADATLDLLIAPGQAAEVQCLLTGERSQLLADSLVLATGNVAENRLAGDLRALGIASRLVGDACAPRLASAAIFEGRKTGLTI